MERSTKRSTRKFEKHRGRDEGIEGKTENPRIAELAPS
jgi:hypothetical protein